MPMGKRGEEAEAVVKPHGTEMAGRPARLTFTCTFATQGGEGTWLVTLCFLHLTDTQGRSGHVANNSLLSSLDGH